MQARMLIAAGVMLASALSAQNCFDTSLGTDLALGDDTCSAALPLGFTFTYNGVGYTTVSVCSNGYLWLGSGTLADWSPTQAELDTGAPRIAPLWMDFNPSATGSGHVYANGTTPGSFTVTWNGVYTFNTTIPGTMQIKLDASNNVTVTYGTLGPSSTAQVGTTIIGASPGGTTTANTVSLATRPAIVSVNNFADVLVTPTGTPAPYSGTKMTWTPTNPGYVIADVTCTPNTLPPAAKSEVVGIGCPPASASNIPTVYETYTSATLDISGMNFTFLPNGGNGFLVVPGIAGPMFTGFTNNLGALDDTTHLVNLPAPIPHAGSLYTQIYVSSNGFITFGGLSNPGSGCCSGSETTLIASASPRLAAYWSDLNPGAGGGVFADLDTATNEFCITWNTVPEFGQPTAVNTFQIALDAAGIMKIRLGTIAAATHTYLTGYSYGGGSTPPAATDLSAIGTFDTGPLQVFIPLAQAAQTGSRPITGTTFNVETTGIPLAPFGNIVGMIIMFQELNPGAPLDVIGATGCTAYGNPTDPNAIIGFLPVLGATVVTTGTPIPNLTSIIGLQVMSQTFSDDGFANAFGFKISNGLRWTISSF